MRFLLLYIYIYILINNDIHKSKAPCTPGVYMERIISRSKITMIKHNRTPSKYRVEEERFNLKNQPFCPLKASTIPFPPKTP